MKISLIGVGKSSLGNVGKAHWSELGKFIGEFHWSKFVGKVHSVKLGKFIWMVDKFLVAKVKKSQGI